MNLTTVLYLGLINWIATIIIVESVLFEDVRGWIQRRGKLLEETRPAVGRKVSYVITCALCTGTWIGFVEALCFGGPLSFGILSFIANGLLFKALGHLFLQVNALAHHRVQELADLREMREDKHDVL